MKHFRSLFFLIAFLATDAFAQLPANWLTLDVGTVGVSGSASESSGTYTLAAGGFDIVGRADAFRYAYLNAKDNASISARVATNNAAKANAPACVMMRQTLNADAIHIAICVTPSGGIQLRYRQLFGGQTTITKASNQSLRAPYYVRLVRTGGAVQAGYSSDGSTWLNLGGSLRINFADSLYIGLAFSSSNTSSTSTATYTNVSTTTNSPPAWVYVSPTATGTGDGSFGNPYTYSQLCATTPPAAISTANTVVWMRGGIYYGSCKTRIGGSSGNLIVIRGYLGERAVIDENKVWTLASPINASTNSIDFVDGSGLPDSGTRVVIDNESIDLNKNGSSTGPNNFNVSVRGLDGTSGASHSAGATARIKGPILSQEMSGFTSNYLRVQNLVVKTTHAAKRVSDTTDSNPPTGRHNDGIWLAATNSQLINNISYDSGQGIFSGSSATNAVIYGNLCFNIGWVAPDRGHGYPAYIQSVGSATNKLAKHNVGFGGFGNYQWHSINSSGSITGLVVDGNIVWANDANEQGNDVFLAGPLDANCEIKNNYTWNLGNVSIVASGLSSSVIALTGNYLHATTPVVVSEVSSGGCTVTGNTFLQKNDSNGYYINLTRSSGRPASDFIVNTNTFYRGTSGNYYKAGSTGSVTSNSFAQWQALGYDAAGTEVSGTPPVIPSSNKIVILPNEYDANLAWLIIYRWDNSTNNVSVDPSSFLSNGDAYDVKYAGNIFGDAVTSGTYAGGNITVSVAPRPMAQPLSRVQINFDTLPNFGVFLIRRGERLIP